ncbi:MAG TPA: hypothetical protein VFH95_06905 [Candidatus Kapabacteria bacterium]|nr:hypothetical protein [Candidatus Kapabacteria bacterium]
MHHHGMRWALLALFVLAFAKTGRSQGSPYDEIGFGLPVRSANATIDALGGTGVALSGTRTINDLNPADWTWLDNARFGAAIRYNYISATLAGTQDLQQNVQFSGVDFGAPIWKPIRLSFALGYEPLTDASNEIQDTSAPGPRNYVSRGGTNLVFLGFAARPLSAIALGARLDYITGDIRHLDQVNFTDTAAAGGQFERDYLFNGLRPTFGIQLIGDSISPGLAGLVIGASYSPPTHLTSTIETINTPVSSTIDSTIDSGGVGRYPAAFSVGISFHLSRRYRAEADYFMQDFSTAYLFSPTVISGDSLLRASNRIAIGIERLPNLDGEFGESFGLDRWGLRLGFSYGTLPVNVGGSGVREFALSGGFGIPVSFQTLLNLSVVAGQRIPITSGTAPNETFVRLGADVSFSEQWFVPTRR